MALTVGVIGLGIMGGAMASNLRKAGFKEIGYDLAPAARRALKREGGVAARSGADVARRAGIVITSLPTVAALAAVSEEIARAKRGDLVVVETSTMPLEAKQAARSIVERSGAAILDCPLSGTGAEARTKDLPAKDWRRLESTTRSENLEHCGQNNLSEFGLAAKRQEEFSVVNSDFCVKNFLLTKSLLSNRSKDRSTFSPWCLILI